MRHTTAISNAGAARRMAQFPVAAAIALVITLFPAGATHAAMYKWVDDKGVVHYTDQVPVDAVNKGNVQLNPQGVPIKKVDPAITPEQRKATEAEQERQRDAAKQQTEAARRDRALLDSYTNEGDIDLAKSRAVKTLQAALESAQGYSTQLTKRKVGLVERKATYAGKPVPAEIEREIAANDAELARQSDIIAQKNRQLVEVAAKYDADKERWQALKNSDPTRPAPAQGMATAATPAPAAARK
jgi:hypothetical protein